MKTPLTWKFWLMRWRHLVLILIAFTLMIFQIIEHRLMHVIEPNRFFYSEIAIYFILLLSAGFLIESLIRSTEVKNQALSILDARYKLSLQLTTARDWEEVVSLVLQYPASIMPVSATSLLMYDPNSEHYQTVSSWVAPHEELDIPSIKVSSALCHDNAMNDITSELHLIPCDATRTLSDGNRLCYCLHIDYGNLSVGMLHIYLPKDHPVTPEQARMLSNTAADVAIVVNTARQREENQASEVANAASNERLGIAHDLHDTLGQNLGYIHFKLDQILSQAPRPSFTQIKPELNRLRDLANESYELVRSTLTILQIDSEHRLSALFEAHAKLISERDSITVNIREEGEPQVLLPITVSQLLNIFKESLYNTEKHAHASQVDVLLVWEEAALTVSVKDDGRGFDPQKVKREGHFGLKIMRDRIARLGGKFEVTSSPDSGTLVIIHVPLKTPEP